MKSKNNFGNILKILCIVLVLSLAFGCSKTYEKVTTQVGGFGDGMANMAGHAEPSVDYYIEDESVDMAYARSEKMMAPTIGMPNPMPPYPEETEPDLTYERKIIKNARLSVEVDDFEAAQIKVMNLGSKYSGFVSDSNSWTDHNGKRRGHITFRIPSIHFDAALIEAGAVGVVLSQDVSGNDVTENYYDTAARLNNSQREESRLLNILDKAEDVDDILRIERELSRVRGDIERSQGRLRYLDNHVSLSSITVELREPTPAVEDYGIWKAFKDALNLFLGTIRFLIRALGFLLPLAVLGAIAATIIIWRVRKGKRRK
ncbi:DUF4349 domain-containing protein [Nanoarchaeota archaeon]